MVVIREDRGVPREDLRALEAAMAAHTRDSMLLVGDRDGTIVLANPAAERMFGYEAGGLNGRHVSVVNAPAAQTPGERAQEILGALQRGRAWHGDVLSVRKDGSTFWSYVELVAFDDPSLGRLWLATHVDASARKQSDEALRAAERRYRMAFTEAPAAMALTDADMRVTDVNTALCELVGRDTGHIQGEALESLIRLEPDGSDRGLWQRVLSGAADGRRIEGRVTCANGRERAVSVSLALARSARGDLQEGVVVIDEQGAR